MITELTPEQIARFPEFVKKWTDIGLCTDPANRLLAEEGIYEAYEIARLVRPKIVWCDSPLSQGLTRYIVHQIDSDSSVRASVRDSVGDSVRDSVGASVRASVGASVRASVWDSVWDSVGDSVRASVGASVRASVGASVRASVGASVRASVWASVRASVWDSAWDSVVASVWDSVGDSVRASVGDSVGASGYGQHDANWLAFYDFFASVCGLESQTSKLSGLNKIAQNAGWFLPCEKICFVSERHTAVHKDAEGRIHNLTGPAISYPDGWNIYAIHGVRVPGYIITNPEQITVDKIESESNAEIRRCMIDIYGQSKYLLDSGAEKIQEDDFGILYRKSIKNDEPLVMVKVVNSTPEPDGSYKDYFLRVHPELRPIRRKYDGNVVIGEPQILTAHNAVASTFGLRGEEYCPEIMT